jgi:hypothetical protein
VNAIWLRAAPRFDAANGRTSLSIYTTTGGADSRSRTRQWA